MTHSVPALGRRPMLAWLALSTPLALHAQEAWPSRPITLVHPYAAGGSADALARLLGRQLEARLKQTVVVEARPGGAATIATAQVARARPDGYTLLLGTSAGHVVTPLMQRIAYDGIGDFRFIGVVASQPNVLIANPGLGVDSLQALIAMARKEPGRLNYGSAGMGGATHLGAEAFAQAAQIKISHVPYNGAPPAIRDLIGGQVQLAMLNQSAVASFIADGRVKPLAYGGAQRSPLLPGVPTMAELGYGNTATATWYTLAAPKGTPDGVVETLRSAMAQAGTDPAYVQALAAQGGERIDLSPQETTVFVQQDKQAMAQLLKSLGMLDK